MSLRVLLMPAGDALPHEESEVQDSIAALHAKLRPDGYAVQVTMARSLPPSSFIPPHQDDELLGHIVGRVERRIASIDSIAGTAAPDDGTKRRSAVEGLVLDYEIQPLRDYRNSRMIEACNSVRAALGRAGVTVPVRGLYGMNVNPEWRYTMGEVGVMMAQCRFPWLCSSFYCKAHAGNLPSSVDLELAMCRGSGARMEPVFYMQGINDEGEDLPMDQLRVMCRTLLHGGATRIVGWYECKPSRRVVGERSMERLMEAARSV